MIISFKVNNCFIYNNDIDFSMQSDMRYKKFNSNVVKKGNINILKTAIIFGPNNSGKTNLIKCFRALKSIMLNNTNILQKNLFTKNNISSMEIAFCIDDTEYLFSFKYDTFNNEYLYERYSKISYDGYNNKKIEDIIIRDSESSTYFCKDEDLTEALQIASKNNLIIYLLDTTKFEILESLKQIIISFANKIEIVDMNNIPLDKTLAILKGDGFSKDKIVNFIKNADLSLDNLLYASDEKLIIRIGKSDDRAQEEVLNVPSKIIDKLHLVSVYNGVPVPSIVFDSTGTKKITALASYVIEAIEEGKILIVDEIDNSLHFKLTRAIISLFNNDLNNKAQLICTVHDVSLLDCKKMFRKEQIWFSYKNEKKAYLYSLSEFKSNRDGVRGDSDDIAEKYKRGVLGALPEPDLFNLLLEV